MFPAQVSHLNVVSQVFVVLEKHVVGFGAVGTLEVEILSVGDERDTNIFKYSENMDFNEFKLKLEQYVKTNPYPVLNE